MCARFGAAGTRYERPNSVAAPKAPISSVTTIGLNDASHTGMALGRSKPDHAIAIATISSRSDAAIHAVSSIPPVAAIASSGVVEPDAAGAESRIVDQVRP